MFKIEITSLSGIVFRTFVKKGSSINIEKAVRSFSQTLYSGLYKSYSKAVHSASWWIYDGKNVVFGEVVPEKDKKYVFNFVLANRNGTNNSLVFDGRVKQ